MQMIKCQSCDHEWREDCLKSEAVEYFSVPDTTRRLVQPDGQRWVVDYGPSGHIVGLHRCNLCPLMVGTETGEA